MTEEDERYFRDIYDHLIRISDLIDTYRDLLTSSMDVYLSTVSNRLNAVMKQLTVMATVFLPLTFITGFFGQNFGWMVGHIEQPGAFARARHRARGRDRRRRSSRCSRSAAGSRLCSALRGAARWPRSPDDPRARRGSAPRRAPP